MTPFGLLAVQLNGGAPGGNGPSRAPGDAVFTLPEGLLQLAGAEELALLAESGAWSPEFLAMLQQLLPPGTPLPAVGMKLPQPGAALAGVQHAPALRADGLPAEVAAGADQALLARLQAGVPGSEASLLPAQDPLPPGRTLLPGLAAQGLGQLLAGAATVEVGGVPTLAPGGVTPGAAPLAGGGPAAALPGAMLTLPQRVGEPGWQQALGERVLWLAGREQQVAELRLNPPHLGPLEVRVVVQQDQASVAFLSQHAAVREALEQALPRLREMLGQQDLQLVQVDVGERHAPQRQAEREGGGQPGQRSSAGSGDPGAAPAGLQASGVRPGHGLIDLFA